MKQSHLFTKTQKENPSGEMSINAQYLIRAGFVDKLSSGVYTLLPLGLRVVKKIQDIVREEMDALDAQEILMPSLHPKEIWETTGRWNVEEMYKIENEPYGLGWTHEEVITPLMKKFLLSNKDLPKAVYQIQTKFRNEPRAKSGLLRGKEFIMKDLYSFHENQDDLDDYYEKVKEAYFNVYRRLNLGDVTFLTLASGGTFSKYSHEFQTITDAGEDVIYICHKCKIAANKEVAGGTCPQCGNSELEEKKAIEVGNIFKLSTKYTSPFNLLAQNGKPLVMGCYGIGITRLLGTVVEVLSDNKGVIWPKSIAPFAVHLIQIDGGSIDVVEKCSEIYEILQKERIEVLYDNRSEKTAGEKLNDADLMGIPLRIVVSQKTLAANSVEIKARVEMEASLVKINELVNYLKRNV
ncbi:MAG: aminoacyl--tRNA ligase-related protein [Candidatus Paceibacterota bacterium]|jgi:prolyl-tRNA synthetase|nr:His/Gly/Thr/Pro-type tRNA ligase C-terminal domain-containing protein [bacterium]